MMRDQRFILALFTGAALAAVAFAAGLWSAGNSSGPSGASSGPPLLVYCAASMRVPVSEIAKQYEAETGIRVELQFGSSNAMLSGAEISGRGDLLIVADDSFAQIAITRHVVDEVIPLAQQSVRLAVHRGNPKNILAIGDLARGDVRWSMPDPDATAIGKVVRARLIETGHWSAIKDQITVVKPTVVDAANDVKTGAVDAAFIWDAMAPQYPQLELLPLMSVADLTSTVPVCVLKSAGNPSAAIAFARYLSASDRGGKVFRAAGYPVPLSDAWDASPQLVLFAGAMMRPAVEETITAFEKREGVRVVRLYNGCGILVGQMKSGTIPDAYFACDPRFMSDVRELFEPPTTISSNRLVIAVPKGNPHSIKSIKDLGQPGLRVGVGHEQQCAMGVVTRDTLIAGGVYEAVRKNVVVQSATGDLLVNQMRTGSLDAAIVYISNLTLATELKGVSIADLPCSIVDQPVAVAKDSRHRQLAQRFLTAVRSAQSKERFEAWGFTWK